jgi:2,3-bisphosphoglycerate-dependent phosphoglycerate mutase
VILLARHGETDDNVPPQRFMGSRDTPLNERGRKQAGGLAAAVSGAGLTAIWCSQLLRARETADVVGASVGVVPRVDARFAESHRGLWEGRLTTEIAREDPDGWAAWRRAGADFRFPGGESLAEHQERVLAALEAVREGDLPALVVAHGGTLRVIAAARHPRGLDAFHELAVPNAALMRLDDLGRWTTAA